MNKKEKTWGKHIRADLKEREFPYMRELKTATWEARVVVSPQSKGLVTTPGRACEVFPKWGFYCWPENRDHAKETELFISAHWVHVCMSSLFFFTTKCWCTGCTSLHFVLR